MQTWFLKLLLSVNAYMHVYVCPPPRLLLTSGVMWHDMTTYDWLNKLYSFYIAAVVSIASDCGLSIDACHSSQPNKS